MTHNLNCELQMSSDEAERSTIDQRTPWRCFARQEAFRVRLIQRAGWSTNSKGRLTIPLSANPAVQAELLHYL